MNGRIYDPLLGRFLSADVLVQKPGDLQSYNRYSYVKNNPLTLTDPSGFAYQDDQAETARKLREHAKEIGVLKQYDAAQTKTAVTAVVATALNLVMPGFGSTVATRILSASLSQSGIGVVSNMAGNLASGKPLTEGNKQAAIIGAVAGGGGQAVGEVANAVSTQGANAAGTPTPGTAVVDNAKVAAPAPTGEVSAAPAAAELTAANAGSKSGATVSVYRGTAHPNVEQTSNAVRAGNPIEAPGDKTFLTATEAREHAFSGQGYHPDGVSVTTDPTVADSYGTHTIEYQIPEEIANQLPSGDPTLGELVFKNNIPDKYRVGTTEH